MREILLTRQNSISFDLYRLQVHHFSIYEPIVVYNEQNVRIFHHGPLLSEDLSHSCAYQGCREQKATCSCSQLYGFMSIQVQLLCACELKTQIEENGQKALNVVLIFASLKHCWEILSKKQHYCEHERRGLSSLLEIMKRRKIAKLEFACSNAESQYFFDGSILLQMLNFGTPQIYTKN